MRGVAVGVDAGGTSTAAVAARDGERAGTFSGEAANATAVGFERAATAIARAVEGALGGERAGAICVGAAGASREEIARGLERALRERFPGARVAVCDDALIALRAAVPEGEGIVLIAGTGSIACGEIEGTAYRAGGYGYLLGDEGSGFALGAAAVRLLLRALDGRAPRDAFTRAVADALRANDALAVLDRVYRDPHPVGALAALAPVVLNAAANGERAAGKIVQGAALELAGLVKSVVDAAGAREMTLPLAFAGGLLRENNLLTYLLETRLNNEYPKMTIRKNAPEPQIGALALASRMLEENER